MKQFVKICLAMIMFFAVSVSGIEGDISVNLEKMPEERASFVKQFLAGQKEKVKIIFAVRARYFGENTPKFTDTEMKYFYKLTKESAEKVFKVVEEGSSEQVNSYGYLRIYRKGDICLFTTEMNSVSKSVGRGFTDDAIKVYEIAKNIDSRIFSDFGMKYILSFSEIKGDEYCKHYRPWGDGITKPAKEINIDSIINEEEKRNVSDPDQESNDLKILERRLDIGPINKENLPNIISILKNNKDPDYQIQAILAIRDIEKTHESLLILHEVISSSKNQGVIEVAKRVLERLKKK